MSVMVKKIGEPERYDMRDHECIGRPCFQPGAYQHRGATGASGSRNTGSTTFECMRRAYHGCPARADAPFDAAVAAKRRAEGWRRS